MKRTKGKTKKRALSHSKIKGMTTKKHQISKRMYMSLKLHNGWYDL